jgi:DNA-binding IclR family transcriptional regulator
VLDKAEGSGFLRAAPRVGSEVPVHATAVGKLYLAFGEGSIQLSADSLEAFTPETSTDRAALEREVARAAERGVAENRDEWIRGLSVVAAAVLSDGGRMVGALAVAAPSPRMEALGRDEIAERMLAAAARVAARLDGVDL